MNQRSVVIGAGERLVLLVTRLALFQVTVGQAKSTTAVAIAEEFEFLFKTAIFVVVKDWSGSLVEREEHSVDLGLDVLHGAVFHFVDRRKFGLTVLRGIL